MSEILANIVVDQTNINFSPDTNNLNITPEAIQLNIFTGAAPVAGGPNTSVQYSNGGVLEGSSDFVFDISNNTVIANLLEVTSEANLGSPSNVVISGGLNGYVLQTDGTGNLSWTAQTGGGGIGTPGGSNTQIQYNDGGVFGGSVGFTFNKSTGDVGIPGSLSVGGVITGTLATNAQPNITSVGTLSNLAVTNDVSAAAVTTGFITLNGNMNSNGTVSAFFFNGNGNPLFGLNASNIVGNVANADFATIAGTVTTNAQPNITSVGTLTSLAVTGNLTSGNLTSNNANLGNLARANFFQGDGSLLSNINGSNITGNLSRISNGTSNVNIATANGNISFSVNGTANVATISNTTLTTNRLRVPSDSIVLGRNAANPTNEIDGLINIGANSGNANGLGGRISIGDSAGNNSNGGLRTVAIGVEAAQNASANGSVMVGYRAGRTASGENSVYVGAGAGINTGSGFGTVAIGYNAKANGGGQTSIGIGYQTAGNTAGGQGSIALGSFAAWTGQGIDSIAIGSDTARNGQANAAIAIGKGAAEASGGIGAQKLNAIAIGSSAGRDNQGANSISIGASAGITSQGNSSIAIGQGAGSSSQGIDAIAIGRSSSTSGQSANAIAIGTTAGQSAQGIGSIAIGRAAGVLQGQFSIALGANAGGSSAQSNNSIIINATGTDFEAPTANALFVKPIRETNNLSLSLLDYNTTTGEISSHVRTFGDFYSNVSQTNPNVANVNLMTFNNTGIANGVSIVSNSQMTIARAGNYNIQFSAQLSQTSGGSEEAYIWLRKNGSDVPYTTGETVVAGNGDKIMAAWNYLVTANVNDYFELAWNASDTSVILEAVAPAGIIPGIASVIATVTPVGA